MFLQIAQMICHHRYICPPFFQTDKDTHANLMYTCLSHAVKTVDSPFKFRLHASWMIRLVVCLVVSFLETDYTVQSMFCQFLILFRFKRHYLNLQIAEIRLCQIQRTGDIRNSGCRRVLTRHEQEILKRSQPLDCFVFIDNLFLCQYRPLHRIADVEAAIDTGVST